MPIRIEITQETLESPVKVAVNLNGHHFTRVFEQQMDASIMALTLLSAYAKRETDRYGSRLHKNDSQPLSGQG